MFLELKPAAHVPRFPGVVGSVLVHIIGVLLVVTVLPHLKVHFDSDNSESAVLQVAWIHLKQPAQLQDMDAAAGSAQGVMVVELPHSELPRNTQPLVLQPELRPNAAPLRTLPEIEFWARQAAAIPKTAPSGQAVLPGRNEPAAVRPRLGARPVLAATNREQVVADINLSMVRTHVDTIPALPRSNSATMPIRIRTETEIATASFDISSGQPTDVLVLAADRKDWRELQIPRGLRSTPQLKAGDKGGSAASTEISGGETSAKRAASHSEVTRIEHPPNGRFDIVILQSGASDDELGVGRVLSGNPVYTVYLRVGDRKEWLLEYCLPTNHSQSADLSRRVVQSGAPVTPPYPISTAIPTSLAVSPAAKRIVFHGLLSAKGSLEGMRASAAEDPLANEILPLLSEWRFRPALKGDQPIDVEVLLVVPTRS